MFLNRLFKFRGINEICCAEFPCPFFLAVVGVNCNNFLCTIGNAALDDTETDAPSSEDGTSGALLDLGSSGCRTKTSGDTTT